MSKIYNLLACHRSRAKKNRMITWIVGIKYGSTKIIWTLSNRFRKALFKIFFFQISRWCCKYSSRSRDMWYVNTSYVERKIFFFPTTILSLAPRALANHSPFPTRRRGRRVHRPAGPTLSPRPLVQAEPHRRAGGSVRRIPARRPVAQGVLLLSPPSSRPRALLVAGPASSGAGIQSSSGRFCLGPSRCW